MVINLSYKEVSGLIARFSVLLQLLALCLFIDIHFQSRNLCFKDFLCIKVTTDRVADQVNR